MRYFYSQCTAYSRLSAGCQTGETDRSTGTEAMQCYAVQKVSSQTDLSHLKKNQYQFKRMLYQKHFHHCTLPYIYALFKATKLP